MSSTKSSNLIVQENRQKAAKMLISVVIIFAICYIPVHVFNLFRYKNKREILLIKINLDMFMFIWNISNNR
jgi:presenilin-like A22 family membrane protease